MSGSRWLWSVALVALLVLLLGSPAWTVPVTQAQWEIQPNDRVVTMFPTALMNGLQTMMTIAAGTELTVQQINGDSVTVSTTFSGTPMQGTVQAGNLCTPAMLRYLNQLGPEYQDYRLCNQAMQARPDAISVRRLGMPTPVPDLTVGANGVITVQGLGKEATPEKKQAAASLLDTYLNRYVAEQAGRVDPAAQFQVLVSCDQLNVDSSSGTTRIFQYAKFFLLSPQNKMLLYEKAIAGEGLSDDAILRDLSRQAAMEYMQYVTRASSMSTPTTGPGSTPFRRPPFPPPPF